MKNGMKKVAVFTLVAGMIAGNLIAAPFAELFQIRNISGKCYVKVASASKFVKAEPNKAYPYGTSVKTDKKGSATIFFSKDNTCVLKANTLVVLTEEENKKNKVITIDKGNIDVNLDKEFHKSNGLKVVTASGTCKAIGCIFSVAQSGEKDKTAVTFDCKEGKIGVEGDEFEAPELGDKDVLAVTTSKDNTFTRTEIVKGDIKMLLKNAQGKQEMQEVPEGSVIKIWRRASESGKDKIVTRLTTDPQGALKGAITYTVPLPPKQVLPKATAVAVPAVAVAKTTDGKKEKEPKKDQPKDDSAMQPTSELLVAPPIIGLSSARGDDAIHKEIEDAKPIAPVVPRPRPRPTPTPVGGV